MAAKSEINARVKALRHLLKANGLDALIVPRSDEYQGEYVPAASERLRWITGFSGSWGTALVTTKQAALVVDGRYTIQASKETRDLKPHILPPDPQALAQFLRKNMQRGAVIGFDPWLTTITEHARLTKIAKDAGAILKPTEHNLIDQIWVDRPAAPSLPIELHATSFAGASSADKLAQIGQNLSDAHCECTLLCDPHSVAWSLNLRGQDVKHTPLALLRALIFKNGKAVLFADKSRLDRQAIKSFGKSVTVCPPQNLAAELKRIGKARIIVDPSFCPMAIRNLLNVADVVEAQDLCSLPRARKNKTEQAGARRAHIRDGAAVSNFLAWLNARAALGGLSEAEAQQKLYEYRYATGKLKDISFETISASGPNAALPHYHVQGGKGRVLQANDIYLIDSGGQYQDGTTDVTRTIAIGRPTPAMKLHNTLVLKGMIAVSAVRFPAGTTGVQIDALARAALWQNGFDFDHGTGHGVGSYLSVHEGPARISKASHVAIEPGMILSNEPGFYLRGKYGIRIENLLLVRPATKNNGGNRPMLSFETLTFVPIDKNLIDESNLTRDEIRWLDKYHAEIWAKISSHVEPSCRGWLKKACEPLKKRP